MKWRMERNVNIVQSSSNMGMIQQAWKYISTYKLTLLIVVAIATAHDISSCTYFTGTGSGSSNQWPAVSFCERLTKSPPVFELDVGGVSYHGKLEQIYPQKHILLGVTVLSWKVKSRLRPAIIVCQEVKRIILLGWNCKGERLRVAIEGWLALN